MSVENKQPVGFVKSFTSPDPKLKLPRNIAPMAVVGIGAVFVLVSMFLGALSSGDVSHIKNNMMIQQHPVTLLCSLAAFVAMFRYWASASVKAVHSIIFVGLWFLCWTIYHVYDSQLVNGYGTKIETTAGPGLWTAGVGCAIILIGGLMMRFPKLDIIGTPTLTAEEKEQIDSLTKICPKCAESIKSAAMVCRYCSYQYPDNLEPEKH